MESINLKFAYRSQNKNGWPLIRVTINDKQIASFQADSNVWTGQFADVLEPRNSLRIWHFGKNYLADCDPDKFFELQQIWINEVNLKHHIHLFRQHAFLPPWDCNSSPEHSLYLGHEGYLELIFDSPVNDWIKLLFGVSTDTMHGQHTTQQCLQEVKSYFDF